MKRAEEIFTKREKIVNKKEQDKRERERERESEVERNR